MKFSSIFHILILSVYNLQFNSDNVKGFFEFYHSIYLFYITKLELLQLRDLAKEKGVSVARTKEDFLRIIKEKNPKEDLERLKGKALFDKVSELHISRLRSKEDLLRLLA